MGSSNSPDTGDKAPGSSVKPTAFVANRIQLAGPVPATLRHRYVGFAPFVKAMFRRTGIRGILLHHALHKQHLNIYKWDKNVVWGVINDEEHGNVRFLEAGADDKAVDSAQQNGTGELSDRGNSQAVAHSEDNESSGSVALARQFLRMTSYGTHGRIFTYVVMLDGEWRFTVRS
jgi:hypothetical protein